MLIESQVTQLSGDLRSEMAERGNKVCMSGLAKFSDEDMSVLTGIRPRKLVGCLVQLRWLLKNKNNY
jgi:hypothetical protein